MTPEERREIEKVFAREAQRAQALDDETQRGIARTVEALARVAE